MALVLYFVFFHRIDSFYMRTWDESVYSVYSYEMMQRGNYLVPSINGVVDLLNDKPPLFFWSQMLSINLFGYNEMAVRLPSAISGALTVIMIFSFLSKRFSFWLGLAAAFVLCSAKGFVTFHSARTGDIDSMLTLGLTGFAISFYLYMQEGRAVHLALYFFFFLFSFFTKSIIVFFLVPVQLFWALGWNRAVFKDWKLWLGVIVSIGAIAGYIALRSRQEANYFQGHMLDYLLRFKQPFYKTHDHPGDFYLNNFYNDRFAQFFFLLFAAFVFIFKETNSRLKRLNIYTSSLVLFFFLVLSFSPTKCYWYDVPLYPLFALIVGYFLWKTASYLSQRQASPRLIPAFLFVFFFVPLYFAIKRSHNNDIADIHTRNIEVVSEYFHDHKGTMPYSRINVGNEQYVTPLLFYKYQFRDTYKKEINITTADKLGADEIFITGNDSVKGFIRSHYAVEQLETYRNATIYKIKSKLS
jgi:4-amino-4-deoxy-L-arabinose transferase-like glycosyltransferase